MSFLAASLARGSPVRRSFSILSLGDGRGVMETSVASNRHRRSHAVCDQSVTTALIGALRSVVQPLTGTFTPMRWWARGDLNFDCRGFATYCCVRRKRL